MPLYARGVNGRFVPILLALGALGILALALRIDQKWLEVHVLQLHIWPSPTDAQVQQIRLALTGSMVIAAIGLLALVAVLKRSSVGRNQAAGLLRIGLAIMCALATVELYLRWREAAHPRPKMTHERFGSPHPRYGWIWTPGLSATERVADRDVRLAFSREGLRVPSPGDEPDPIAPSLLFTGESVAAGQGLQYEETFASLVSAELGLQPVNLAVNGYGCDQAYLRLLDALPRFEHVRATVTTFLPVQLGRNLQDLKPRLVLNDAASLEWIPGATGFFARLRLRRLLMNELPYSSDRAIASTVAVSRAILRETDARTRAKGAKAIFLVPSQGPPRTLEQHPEAWVIRTVFEAERLPYILVDLSGDLTLPGDPHPSPKGARLIADILRRSMDQNRTVH
jgi:hypothetical protein